MREIAFGAILAILVATTSLLVAAWPAPGRPVAAFFPKGMTASQTVVAIGAAGGHLLQMGETPDLAISVGDHPGYVDDLYRAGAWLVVSATLARLCQATIARAGP
jgi:hypothetical protein